MESKSSVRFSKRPSKLSRPSSTPSKGNRENPAEPSDSIENRKSRKSLVIIEPFDIFTAPLYNKDGSRNTKIPFDLFVVRKKEEERSKNKKQINVSVATRNDSIAFKEALKRLKSEQVRSNSRRTRFLKGLVNSRSVKRPKTSRREQKYPCLVQCNSGANRKRSKSRSRSRSRSRNRSKSNLNENTRPKRPVIQIPPIKTKPWKSPLDDKDKPPKKGLSRFPKIVIPPFKTRKWVPKPFAKPRPKIVIEYPPLKLRSRPWKPKSDKKIKKRTFQVTQLHYPIPVSTLGKTWHSFKFISSKQQILCGNFSQYSKKFSFSSNGKQSAFISAVAISTVEIYPMKLWKASVLDEIISYGDVNFRRHLPQLKHKNVIKPSDVYHKIYLKHAKVLVEIGESISKGIYDPDHIAEVKSHITDMFDKFSSLIILYHGQNYAIWKEDKAYYILNSEDTNDKGKLVEKSRGGCCVIRSTSLPTIIDYLIDTFRVVKHLYEIFSFRVNQKVLIHDLDAPQKPQHEIMPALNEPSNVEETVEQMQIESPPKTGIAAVLFRQQMEPTFGDNFKRSALANHAYMTCPIYLTSDMKNRASFISSVATVMLQICKSSLWMSATLEKIFQIGHEVYIENVEKVLLKREKDEMERLKAMEPEPVEEPEEVPNPDEEDEDYDSDEEDKPLTKEQIREMRRERLKKPPKEIKIKADIPITEIRPIVTIGKFKYELAVEILNIGKVMSKSPEELSLESGIKNLFKHYDYGLIIGADVVAVWRENNRYFMFDPNSCKGYSRMEDTDGENFNSCLHCFENLTDLVKLYIDNLSKSKRNSVYKICKIESRNYTVKSSSWQDFKAIGQNKWILCGTLSESSDEFNELNRNHQSTCMSVTALAKSREIGISTWTSDTIDEIVRIGDEFYAGCVYSLKQNEKFENPNLNISELGSELKLDKVVVDLSYEESAVYGKLYGDTGSFVSLAEGLKMFFKNDDLGVLTACNVSVAVAKFNEGFFLFDSHSRDEYGRNYNTVDPVNSCTVKGAACMMKFLNTEDLANHLISNLEITDSTFYSISKVEVSARSTQAPCLYHYKVFGDEEYGAILQAFDNYHEDCEQFKCTQNEKTLCNLLSCLFYAGIYNPRLWESNDINEILKIGWKILCVVSKNLENLWHELKSIDICSLKMSIEIEDEMDGIFMAKERPFSSIENAAEVFEEQFQYSELNKSIKSGEMSDENVSITRQDRSSTFQTLTPGENLPNLRELLSSMESLPKVFTVLTSSLFTISIFKIDGFYYVFDPKASSLNGMLVRKRLEDFIKNHLAKEHEILLGKLRESDSSRRLSVEEQMEELIFGRQVIFTAPTVKPSQHEMILSVSYGAFDDEGPITISEKGSAYVTWFTNIDLVHRHVINKIPEKFIDQAFKLQYLKITKETQEIEENAKWNNFENIDDNHWIIRGTFSQNDSQFPATHRNNQDVANCILALAFKNFCNFEDWNSTALDVVLKFGDRLFRKSLGKKLKTTSLHASELKLKFSEMELPIFIRPYIINCCDKMISKDFAIKATDKVPLENLKEVVKNFLESDENTGFLCCKNYYVAIWRCDDGSFMMFDPHDIGPDGRRKASGLSSLQRFNDHIQLVEIFWNNVKDFDGFNEYQLIGAKVELTHFKDGEEDVFESLECDSLPLELTSRMKIIGGLSSEASTTQVEITICYAVAAHCLCQALDSEYYTSDIIDRIIMFGNELVNECCTNDEVCFKDFNLGKHSSCPDEINWNFQLNDTFTTVQMDIFRRGTITKQPCPLPNLVFVLEEFFNFHCYGVLVTSDFIVPLWKDNSEYFVFYSCPINEHGLRRRDRFGKAGLIIFKSVHELYTNIVQNIHTESLSFELRVCNIKMNDDADNLQNKICNTKKSKKKLVKEEVIMPAVSFREVEGLDNKDAELCKKNIFHELIDKLKNRRPCDKGFMRFSRGGFICGKLSKDSKSLNEISRKYHCPAICFYSAAMHAVISMNCWESDVIDCVILSGNNLYVESSIISGTSKVDITSIVSPIFIQNHEIKAKAESCLEIAIEDYKIDYLKSVLCQLLSCYSCCFFEQSWNLWTIVKSGKFLFLFDPRGLEIPGKKIPRLHATLYRFDSMELLLEQLENCIRHVDSTNPIKIGGIIISLKTMPKEINVKVQKEKKTVLKCPVYKEPKPVLSIKLQELSQEQPNCSNQAIKFC